MKFKVNWLKKHKANAINTEKIKSKTKAARNNYNEDNNSNKKLVSPKFLLTHLTTYKRTVGRKYASDSDSDNANDTDITISSITTKMLTTTTTTISATTYKQTSKFTYSLPLSLSLPWSGQAWKQ